VLVVGHEDGVVRTYELPSTGSRTSCPKVTFVISHIMYCDGNNSGIFRILDWELICLMKFKCHISSIHDNECDFENEFVILSS